MRARHRHINPVSASATFAWDTRYDKDGVANNGFVSTWTDRGGKTATQTGSTALQPLWKTNQISGFPAVVFDGGNDTLSTSSVNSTTGVSVIVVGKRPWATGKYAPIVASSYGLSSGLVLMSTANPVWGWDGKDFVALGNGYNTTRAPRAVGPYGSLASGTTKIISTVLSSTLARVWFDGSGLSSRTELTASFPSITSALSIGGFASTSDYGDFSFGHISYWRDTSLSNSLRRRFQHAAAYSFKVPCA